MNKLTKEQAAYIAGIVDGEGYLRLSEHDNRVSGHIRVGQKDIRLLFWLKETTGVGNIRRAKSSKVKNGFFYLWNLSPAKEQILFLKEIIPYLVLKSTEAKLLLVVAKTIGPCTREVRTKAPRILSPKIISFRKRALNTYKRVAEEKKTPNTGEELKRSS